LSVFSCWNIQTHLWQELVTSPPQNDDNPNNELEKKNILTCQNTNQSLTQTVCGRQVNLPVRGSDDVV